MTSTDFCHGPKDTSAGSFQSQECLFDNEQVEDLQNRAKQRAMKILRHSPQYVEEGAAMKLIKNQKLGPL